jgi:multicomponent Na+:H+ antiporter subunit B
MIGPRSWIFQVVVRFAFFIINVFALYLLLRGHNQPGGGFIAGLASAAALILLSLAIGIEALHRLIRVDPVRMAAGGLLLALLSGAGPMLSGAAFLTQFNWHLHDLPLLGELHVGTPLVFDVGVYLVVIGICAKIIFVLVESTEGLPGLVVEEERRYSSPLEEPIEERPAAGKEMGRDAD